MAGKIFLSVGKTSSEKQEKFVQDIENYLRANDLTPQTVGRTYFTSQQPLKAINELMGQCIGSVILAYERVHIDHGFDRPGHPEQKEIQAVKLPTVWNQIEAAMAYNYGHPLLVIVEKGLKNEGLLEVGYDWYVIWTDLDPASLLEPSFVGAFSDWKSRCEAYGQQREQEPAAPNRAFSDHAQAIPGRQQLIALRQILSNRFSEGELRVLCFDLGIDFENLPGEEKIVKAMELVSFLQRTDRLAQLVELGRQIRPDVDWPNA